MQSTIPLLDLPIRVNYYTVFLHFFLAQTRINHLCASLWEFLAELLAVPPKDKVLFLFYYPRSGVFPIPYATAQHRLSVAIPFNLS